MKDYPVFLRPEYMDCLVVGGGSVAARKIAGLLEVGAKITVISPELTAETEKLLAGEKITHHKRSFQTGDLAGFNFVIAATSDSDANRKIARQAHDRDVLVNVIDNKELSSFIVPAVCRRGPLQMAICSGGTSPALAAEVKRNISGDFGRAFARYLEILAELRPLIKSSVDPERRRVLLQKAGGKTPVEYLRRGELKAALDFLRELLPSSLKAELDKIIDGKNF